MKHNFLRSRAFKIAAGIVLGSCTMAAQADPFSLQAVCRLSSIISGQGVCQLEYILSDGLVSPANVRKTLIKVDTIPVSQYVNDVANPVQYSAGTVSGAVFVACGVNHNVIAYIARVGASTPYELVGSLSPVLCPAVH